MRQVHVQYYLRWLLEKARATTGATGDLWAQRLPADPRLCATSPGYTYVIWVTPPCDIAEAATAGRAFAAEEYHVLGIFGALPDGNQLLKFSGGLL